jgi:DNA invertase Pin-like site-specific DNA recombinase
MKTVGADLYARVSTAEQQRLPMQISAMREYAERRSWTVVASIEDVASNAKDRPKRQELTGLSGSDVSVRRHQTQ